MITATQDETRMIGREGQAMTLRHERRVLLIDDDRWVRALFSDVLASMGCEVQAAASGEEGLALFARGEYHLVITDLEMGSVGGLEVARAVQAAAGQVPVIIMTGFAHALDQVERRFNGCTVMAKPVRLPDFQAAVLRALDG